MGLQLKGSLSCMQHSARPAQVTPLPQQTSNGCHTKSGCTLHDVLRLTLLHQSVVPQLSRVFL